MGYFPNGTSGLDYEERYCVKCAHYGPPDGPGCPIWALHMMWNYDACNDPRNDSKDHPKAFILNTFIPRDDEKLCNKQCVMFVPASALTVDLHQAQKDQQKLHEWEAIYGKRKVDDGTTETDKALRGDGLTG